MQAVAKLTIGIGLIITMGCIWMAFLIPLPEGVQWISAWTVLLYAVPAALIPVTATIIIAGRFKRVLVLKCTYCQHSETVYVRG